MKSVGLIQPGKLGDIIICLPIAHYYFNKGYKIIWPIFFNFKSMFEEVIDYVNFIPITNNVYNCIDESSKLLKDYNVDQVFDVAATFPGSTSTEEYVKLGDGFGKEKFDEFKYRKCNVPFENKWNLTYKRNVLEEKNLFNKLVKNKKFDVVCTKHSRGQVPVKFETKNELIEITDNYNIFYWRKILEEAQKLALVDSALSNLVEQLNIKTNKILITKPGHPMPVYKNNWTIISL